MMQTNMFFKIAAVDEATRVIKGVMCTEEPDRVKEIMDYDGSKSYVQAWSDEVFNSTNGQSYGNVRAMHGKMAVGKINEPLTFDDENKQIFISAEIVDDNEWAKVEKGLYCGFSVGGNYVEKWKDGQYTRYTAKPVEVSIVDFPQMPSAKFAFAKMSGEVEERDFIHGQLEKSADGQARDDTTKSASVSTGGEVTHTQENNVKITNDQVAAHAAKLAKAAGKPETEFAVFIEAARSELEKGADPGPVIEENKVEELIDQQKTEAEELDGAGESTAAKAAAPDPRTLVKQVWTTPDGETFEKKADAISHVEVINDPVAKAAQDAINAAKGAMSKAATPVVVSPTFTADDYAYTPNADDRTTWRLRLTKSAGGGHDPRLLCANAAAIGPHGFLGHKVTIPAADRPIVFSKLRTAFEKASLPLPEHLIETNFEKFASGEFEKGVYDVSRFTDVLSTLVYLRDSASMEAAMEGDNSPIPGKLTALIDQMVPTLVQWLGEEVNELIGKPMAFDESGVGVLMVKAAENELEKVGARNSKADQDKLQAMHDHSVELGAMCGSSEKAATGDMEKLAATNNRLEKMVGTMTDTLTEMTTRLARIEAQPAAVERPARTDIKLNVVEKAADSGDGMTLDRAHELLKNATPDQLATAAIRLSHSTGGIRVAAK